MKFSTTIINSMVGLKTNYVQAKYVTLLSMLYCAALIVPIVLAYRPVSLGPFISIPGGALIFPSTYLFGGVISEVYGYKVARQLLWSAIIVEFIFALSVVIVIHLPHPSFWHDDGIYKEVLGNSLRFVIASALGTTLSELANIYIITKTKLYVQGKYFWLRCFISFAIGEIILTLIVYSITFIGVEKISRVIELMINGYIYKVIFSMACVIPATVMAQTLKKVEGLDVYDNHTNFTPFSFSLNDQ